VSRFALVAVAVALVLAGCSHRTKPARTTACDRARIQTLREPAHNVLRGDVDGDGAPDSVALVRLRRAPERCGAFLVVRTRSHTLARPFARPPVPDVPSLNGLAALGEQPGLHIVVTTWHGASTEFARVFAVRGDRIAPVETGTPDHTFPYEGSVTHIEAVDCASDGSVVASGWFFRGSGRRFGFFRHFYRVGPAGFAPVRSQSGTSRSSVPLRRFREFQEPQPFPSCMRVRAPAAS
jgi:hypothetical protein